MANFDIDSGFVFILSKEECMDCYAALLTAADHMIKPETSRRLRELADRIKGDFFVQVSQRIVGGSNGTN